MTKEDPIFDKAYVSDTEDSTSVTKEEDLVELEKSIEAIEPGRYGISKPRRIVIRGIITHDKSKKSMRK